MKIDTNGVFMDVIGELSNIEASIKKVLLVFVAGEQVADLIHAMDDIAEFRSRIAKEIK